MDAQTLPQPQPVAEYAASTSPAAGAMMLLAPNPFLVEMNHCN